MRRLMLFRHAKADRPAGVADEDRPLTGRGRRDSAMMGQYMARHGLVPDLALVSTARRAAETWEFAAAEFERKIPHREEPRLYYAEAPALFELVRETEPEIGVLLVVGHNPGLHEFAIALAGGGSEKLRGRLREGLPTGGLVVIDCEIDAWPLIAPGLGTVERFERPDSVR